MSRRSQNTYEDEQTISETYARICIGKQTNEEAEESTSKEIR